MTVTLKHFQSEDLETLWKVAFSDPKAEWHQWDGPYFNQEVPTLQELQENQANQTGFQWVANPFCQRYLVKRRFDWGRLCPL